MFWLKDLGTQKRPIGHRIAYPTIYTSLDFFEIILF